MVAGHFKSRLYRNRQMNYTEYKKRSSKIHIAFQRAQLPQATGNRRAAVRVRGKRESEVVFCKHFQLGNGCAHEQSGRNVNDIF